jgi:hypothetical protein
MLEHHHAPLLPRRRFARRLARNFTVATGIVAGSLLIGVLGYHVFARLSWIDAFLNASMILTGMGPASDLPTDGAKIFASFYALFSGVIFLTAVAVLIAPLFHRFMHRFHLEDEEEASGGHARR